MTYDVSLEQALRRIFTIAARRPGAWPTTVWLLRWAGACVQAPFALLIFAIVQVVRLTVLAGAAVVVAAVVLGIVAVGLVLALKIIQAPEQVMWTEIAILVGVMLIIGLGIVLLVTDQMARYEERAGRRHAEVVDRLVRIEQRLASLAAGDPDPYRAPIA